jgi:hypothetical protein
VETAGDEPGLPLMDPEPESDVLGVP